MSDGSLASPVDTGAGPPSAPRARAARRLGLPGRLRAPLHRRGVHAGIDLGHLDGQPRRSALLGVTIWALVRVRREGLGALRGSLWLWLAILALLGYSRGRIALPDDLGPDYAWKTHLGTAVKFAEYAVLVPVSAVLLRTPAAWAGSGRSSRERRSAAALVAALQFVGVSIFEAWPTGPRQPSFTGISVLGTLGAAALALGFAGVLWPGPSRAG